MSDPRLRVAQRVLAVRGAREHNLRGVDLDLPLGDLVVFAGVSGSGKSSLAVDTLYAEGRRRLLGALGAGAAQVSAPEVDLVSGLPPTVGLVAREQARPSLRSIVATAADVFDLMRSLWGHGGTMHCPDCGRPLPVHTAEEIVAAMLALDAGTRLSVLAPISLTGEPPVSAVLDEVRSQGFSRVVLDGVQHRLDELPAGVSATRTLDVVIDRIRVAPDRESRLLEAVQTALAAGAGRVHAAAVAPGQDHAQALSWADHPRCPEHDLPWAAPAPRLMSFNSSAGACLACGGLGETKDETPCPECGGARLGPVGRHTHLSGLALPAVLALQCDEALRWLSEAPLPAPSRPIRAELTRRIGRLVDLGLGGLPLGRPLARTSSSERHRVALAAVTGSELSGVLYVLDEPCAGLDPDAARAVLALIRRLVDQGSTVLAVDHQPDTIRAATHVVEFGPGAGAEGGAVVFEGSPEALAAAKTSTGAALRGELAAPPPVGRDAEPLLYLRGARAAGPDGVDLEVLRGRITVVTGPGGAGKSTLIDRTLWRALAARAGLSAPPPLLHESLDLAHPVERLVRLERGPLGANARSCVATAAGVWTPIRQALAQTREARLRGFAAGRFSFNQPGGRCDACQGAGVRRLDMALLPDAEVVCEVCDGRRFDHATRSIRLKGASVDQILAMTVSEALRNFDRWPQIRGPLRALERVGLGYLELGQQTDTLSGGEGQRLRLARELTLADRPTRGGGLAQDGVLYVLDEPTVGLHPADSVRLVTVLRDLADAGASVVCASVDPLLVAAADAVTTLGGAG